MVVKKSEYQKQFKACIVKKNQDAYLENLNIRNQRRDREFMHTPLCWGDEVSEEETSSDCNTDECKAAEEKKEPVPKEPAEQYQSLAEIISDSKEKALAIKKKRQEEDLLFKAPVKVPSGGKISYEDKENENVPSDKKDMADKSYSIYDMVDDENRKLHEKIAQPYKMSSNGKLIEDISDESDTDLDMKEADRLMQEKAKKSNLRKTYTKKKARESQVSSSKQRPTSAKSGGKSAKERKARGPSPCPVSSTSDTVIPPSTYVRRVRRPDRQDPIPKAKSRPKSADSPLKARPPFLAYGVGDKEDNLAVHRTHNVRSSADVYGAALRAKLRREEERRVQRERMKRAQSAEDLLDKLTSVTPRDASDWESEYRKQFHGYEPQDYERAVSARSVIPRGRPIKAGRAVHRGGCLVVHVD